MKVPIRAAALLVMVFLVAFCRGAWGAPAPRPSVEGPALPPPPPLDVRLPAPPAPREYVPRSGPPPIPAPIDMPLPSAESHLLEIEVDDAVAIALHHQASLRIARGTYTRALAHAREVAAGLNPRVTLNATGGSNAVTLESASNGSLRANNGITAEMQQLIFDFSHTRDLVRREKELLVAAAADLTQSQLDAVQRVKNAFYTFVRDYQLMQVLEEKVRRNEEQASLARLRLEGGIGLPSEQLRAQSDLANAINALVRARDQAYASRLRLNLALGLHPAMPIRPRGEGEPAVDETVETLLDVALTQRPEIKSALATVRAAEVGMRAAASTNAPRLVGTTGIIKTYSGSALNAGVQLNWNVSDGGLTSSAMAEARATFEIAEATLTVRRQDVLSEVLGAYHALRSAEQRLTTSANEVANAEEALALAMTRFRVGLGDYQEVYAAQQAEATARTDRVTAECDVQLARVALSRAIGTLPKRRQALSR